MLIAYWPLLILVAGVLIWVLASNATVKEIGKWMFVVGLFFTTRALSEKTASAGGVLIAYWPLLILVIGVLIWALASNAILKEIGKWMFIIGLFFTVDALSHKTVKVGSNDGSVQILVLHAPANGGAI